MKEFNILHDFDKSKIVFGFWIYIMSDCILFATLFAVYAVLYTHTFNGPTTKDLFNLYFVLIETLILLTSSFTYGLTILSQNINKKRVIQWMIITFTLGFCFILMEIYEFYTFYNQCINWTVSAFLSSFFTLIGVHGIHVSVGLIWMILIIFSNW